MSFAEYFLLNNFPKTGMKTAIPLNGILTIWHWSNVAMYCINLHSETWIIPSRFIDVIKTSGAWNNTYFFREIANIIRYPPHLKIDHYSFKNHPGDYGYFADYRLKPECIWRLMPIQKNLKYRISNKEFRTAEVIWKLRNSIFVILCSAFCGSKTILKWTGKNLRNYFDIVNNGLLDTVW